MDETLSQKKMGRKTFQGIANRQNDTRFQRREFDSAGSSRAQIRRGKHAKRT
ncbi:hypothetical protein [Caballeronia sordidicola]|uniref:hypothetical protein n=1 Tax=Caballeronia sordidicola TaxID=196367 RepID=UPI000AE55E1A|nr:hypothetical protein [Caballeronia sordidicola]